MKCPRPDCDDSPFSRRADPCLAWAADRIKRLEKREALWLEYVQLLSRQLDELRKPPSERDWSALSDTLEDDKRLRAALGLDDQQPTDSGIKR